MASQRWLWLTKWSKDRSRNQAKGNNRIEQRYETTNGTEVPLPWNPYDCWNGVTIAMKFLTDNWNGGTVAKVNNETTIERRNQTRYKSQEWEPIRRIQPTKNGSIPRQHKILRQENFKQYQELNEKEWTMTKNKTERNRINEWKQERRNNEIRTTPQTMRRTIRNDYDRLQTYCEGTTAWNEQEQN